MTQQDTIPGTRCEDNLLREKIPVHSNRRGINKYFSPATKADAIVVNFTRNATKYGVNIKRGERNEQRVFPLSSSWRGKRF